jgi:hypothetical protein
VDAASYNDDCDRPDNEAARLSVTGREAVTDTDVRASLSRTPHDSGTMRVTRESVALDTCAPQECGGAAVTAVLRFAAFQAMVPE